MSVGPSVYNLVLVPNMLHVFFKALYGLTNKYSTGSIITIIK